LALGASCYITDYQRFGKELSHYHIHPSYAWKELLKREIKRIEEKNKRPIDDFESNSICSLNATISSFPSISDIDSFSYILRRNNTCEIDFKIVSPFGILTTTLLNHKRAFRRYKQRFNKLCTEPLVDLHYYVNPFSVISSAIIEINKSMDGILNLSMEYFDGL